MHVLRERMRVRVHAARGAPHALRRTRRAARVAQTAETKSVLCALPSGGHDDAPECSCCEGLPSLKKGGAAADADFELTGGGAFRNRAHFATLEGCNDYQAFWD